MQLYEKPLAQSHNFIPYKKTYKVQIESKN